MIGRGERWDVLSEDLLELIFSFLGWRHFVPVQDAVESVSCVKGCFPFQKLSVYFTPEEAEFFVDKLIEQAPPFLKGLEVLGQIPPEFLSRFCDGIAANRNLQELRLTCALIDTDQFLQRGLTSTVNLKTLSLEHNPVSLRGAQLLASALSSQSLLSLNLVDTSFDDECMRVLFSELDKCRLKHLSLRRNPLTEKGIQYLADWASKEDRCELEELNLSLTGCGVVGLGAVVESFGRRRYGLRRLKACCPRNTEKSEEHARRVGFWLARCLSLEHVELEAMPLSGWRFGHEDVQESHREMRLQTLDLRHCGFTNEDGESLANLLAIPTLSALALESETAICDESSMLLFFHAVGSSRLEELHMRAFVAQGLREASGMALQESLGRMEGKHVTILTLSKMNMNFHCMLHLSERFQHLVSLDLCENSLEGPASIALISGIQTSSQLECIRVFNCHLGLEALVLLVEALICHPKLRECDVGMNNAVPSKGRLGTCFAKLLSSCTRLDALCVSYNALDAFDGKLVGDALSMSPPLKRLKSFGNVFDVPLLEDEETLIDPSIAQGAVFYLIKCLLENTNIEYFEFQEDVLSVGAVHKFRKLLDQSTSLRFVSVRADGLVWSQNKHLPDVRRRW